MLKELDELERGEGDQKGSDVDPSLLLQRKSHTLSQPCVLFPFDTPVYFFLIVLFPSPCLLSFPLYFFISSIKTPFFSLFLYLTDWCFVSFPPQIEGSLFSAWSRLIDLLVFFIKTLSRHTHLMEVKETFFSYLAMYCIHVYVNI